ncbi:MAG: PBP1A family penicillin-binding protein [Rhodospirillales bacterium]|nr:MAG: PBP1A family penicillin-binding protein [Rhodospirillales bacterium]
MLKADPKDRIGGRAAKPAKVPRPSRRSDRTRGSRSGRDRPSRRPPLRWFGRTARWTAKWAAVLLIWVAVGLGLVVAWFATDLPDIEAAVAATRRPSITVLAADGTELATAGDLYGYAVTVDTVPPALPLAMLATEDRRFYRHFGIDVFGLVRAAHANIRAGGIVQGGSTITQQVAKNLFLTPARTWERKVQELILAFWLERRFTKDEILALYMNRAYFGAGAYGVDAAARKFFGVSASRLSTYQSAMLAGLLRAPSRYNPQASPERAAGRTRQVLAGMVDAGFISEAEASAAERRPGAIVAVRGGGGSSRYFVDWVMDQVPDFVSADDRDLIVVTTLDPRLQGLAESRVATMLAGEGAGKRVSQGALVAMTYDGAVRAMVGGRSYAGSQFNRAAQARRQPGSAFKPFVYLAGLEAGLTPGTRMVDGPIAIGTWRPTNFQGGFLGEVSLEEALAYSVNTVAVQVSEHAGRNRVIRAARRLGLTGDLQATPSVALGVSGTSPVEITAAYAAFANGGIGVFAFGIDSIHDRDGKVLYQRGGTGAGRVMSPTEASHITRMLVSAVDWGTARAAKLDRPVAGKTGTSQSFRDAWFIGFTADLVSGVWMGNDDDRPMDRVTGGTLPATLWRQFMAEAHAGTPVRPLPSLLPDRTPGRAPPIDERQDRDFFERLIDAIAGQPG